MKAVTTGRKHVTLNDGFEVAVSIDEYGDMELLEDIVELGDGDPAAMVRVVRRMFSPEEKNKLWEHLRKDGTVRVPDVMDALQEIFEKLQGDNDDIKKS